MQAARITSILVALRFPVDMILDHLDIAGQCF
jgi:hypothetical protein